MCAHAVRVVVRKIEGVQDVKVSLEEGVATIQFAPSNRVRIEQIRKAIRSNGFTPRTAELRAAGVLIQRGDTVLLSVTGSEDTFTLLDAADSKGQVSLLRQRGTGGRVTVSGQLPETTGMSSDSARSLFVRSFTAQ